MSGPRSDKRVLVCDKCLRASCWYGEFMCDDARSAGLGVMTVGDLRKLGREHPSYWTDVTFEKHYGTRKPDFSQERFLSRPASRPGKG